MCVREVELAVGGGKSCGVYSAFCSLRCVLDFFTVIRESLALFLSDETMISFVVTAR